VLGLVVWLVEDWLLELATLQLANVKTSNTVTKFLINFIVKVTSKLLYYKEKLNRIKKELQVNVVLLI
jgi:hypothetical protein